jgi:prepilin-type N-terminal cleavage/methylation domain-containing protein
MKVFAAHRSCALRCAGFTLTEVSVVFVIVGLIFGAVWGAASLVSTRARINQAVDEINMIVGNGRALYAGQNTSFNALSNVRTLNITPTNSPPTVSPTGSDFCYYSPIMAAQKVFPPEMVAANPPPWVANHPWASANMGCGSGTSIGTAQVAIARNVSRRSPVLFVVRYTSLPSTVCPQLLMLNSLPGPDTQLTQISVMWGNGAPTNYTGTQLPISAPVASAACTGSGTLTIDWYYQLGG